jgi:hypothetical protein
MSDASPFLTPRRGFLARLAAGAAALGVGGTLPRALHAGTAEADYPDSNWPGKLTGRHRQVVDGYSANDGFPLTFAYTFLMTNPKTATNAHPATAVVVLRHTAFPIALKHELWEKYKIGQSLNIVDPETKAPAVKNPFLDAKPGVLPVDEMAIDKLLAKGTVIGACNIALHVLSGKLAGNAGVSADEAAKEWTAGVIPGVTVIPSGTWGVNRAQEAGCTYCAGG